MNTSLSKSRIQISTVHNEELTNITNISKFEQDPTVDNGRNGQ
jgi:hypothetical protein